MQMEGLCRFCAKPGSGIDVFGEAGHKRNLYNQIKLCLPINITVNDGMTTHICFPCVNKLNISYEFHTTSVSVQYQLKSLIEKQHKVNESTLKTYSKPDISMHKPSESTYSATINDSNKLNQNNETFLRMNNNCGLRIEAVQSIPQNLFQDLPNIEEGRKNGKRLLENTNVQTADTVKKKERMTVCQYCRKWFPRSIISHHEKLHVKGSITFNCTSCNKDFHEADDFKNHNCVGEGD